MAGPDCTGFAAVRGSPQKGITRQGDSRFGKDGALSHTMADLSMNVASRKGPVVALRRDQITLKRYSRFQVETGSRVRDEATCTV